jgi:hypothetical protein
MYNILIGVVQQSVGGEERPSSWKEAVVVPIQKPGKDPVRPTSYRPIALTSRVKDYGTYDYGEANLLPGEQGASIATSEWVQEGAGELWTQCSA